MLSEVGNLYRHTAEEEFTKICEAETTIRGTRLGAETNSGHDSICIGKDKPFTNK